jgi:type II secretory pathway pseudopilin PulG
MMNQKGQSLVEALIALGVASMVVSAMAVAAITAVNNSDFSKYQSLAANYAQQGMEIVRQKSQTDWNYFYNTYVGHPPPNVGLWCLDGGSSALVSRPAVGCGQNISQNGKAFFKRDVELAETSSGNLSCHGTVLATITVSWTDGKCSGGGFCHDVTIESCFTDINAGS